MRQAREAARQAVQMIQAARAYMDGPREDTTELRAIFGNRSYLSGLDADDPRNLRFPSLMPPRNTGPAGGGEQP